MRRHAQAEEGAAAADEAPEARRNAFKLLQQATVGKQRPGTFFKDSFVDMEVRPPAVPRRSAGSANGSHIFLT